MMQIPKIMGAGELILTRLTGNGEWDLKPHARIIALLYPEISVPVRYIPVLITGFRGIGSLFLALMPWESFDLPVRLNDPHPPPLCLSCGQVGASVPHKLTLAVLVGWSSRWPLPSARGVI